jgi:hypothetical protein
MWARNVFKDGLRKRDAEKTRRTDEMFYHRFRFLNEERKCWVKLRRSVLKQMETVVAQSPSNCAKSLLRPQLHALVKQS